MVVRVKSNCSPDFADLIASRPERYPFLLESSAYHPDRGRYDILFAYPESELLLSQGRLFRDGEVQHSADFFAALDNWFADEQVSDDEPNDLPFSGGWFVYLGYEIAAQIEPSLDLPTTKLDIPSAFAMRIPLAVIRDRVSDETWVVAEDSGDARISEVLKDLQSANGALATRAAATRLTIDEEMESTYLDAVQKIKRYIEEGDVFQVNLSRVWSASLAQADDIVTIYRHLRERNPAPFSGICRYHDFAIASSSPERLIQVRNRWVETRPIAGTRPRSDDPDEDQRLSDELRAHPKEQAEHIMLIDLERNDLGRVCEPGSVEVEGLMGLESYAHVHHIVSAVTGRLRDGITPGETLKAVFPGGTITGCPKVRCMQIIAELEKTGRGAYTGSLGFINRNGDMDFNILIRTVVAQGQHLEFRTGAGIVADSDPRLELEETRAKARGLLLALDA